MLSSKGNMLSSKGDMLPSKGDMLSCMILLAMKLNARAQLLARSQQMHSSKINALVHDFTRDSNLMLARITRRAFSTCLRANFN